MKTTTKNTINLHTLAPEIRSRIEHALDAPDTMFSRKFRRSDIESWDRVARAHEMSTTKWVEKTLNEARDLYFLHQLKKGVRP